MIDKPDSALVIVGHGSTENPDSATPNLLHALEIERQGCFAEVVTCFWKEEPSMREVLRMVDSREVYIVPNFISEGYFTQTVIPRELELDGPLTYKNGRVLKYCEPVGNHPHMTPLLLKRASETAPGVPPEECSLLIVGHGTSLNDNSAKAAKLQAERIQQSTGYAAVLNTYMEEPPLITDWHKITNTPYVVVVPFFISDGLHSYQDIPVMLGIESEPTAAASQREIFRNNPYRQHGRELYYASAIGTEPGFAGLILDQVMQFDATYPDSVQQETPSA